MSEVSYALAPEEFTWDAVPISDHFAIVGVGPGLTHHIIRRTRTNGQTFDLTYKDEAHAKRGLSSARTGFGPGADLWRRPS